MIAFIIMITVILLGGLGFIFLMYIKKKKESEEDNEKYEATTQDQLPVEYIRSGIVKLKNAGDYRILVELPSINIDLMEPSEKQVVLEQYRQILNAIEFPFQYLQQSRVVDVSDYIGKLEKLKNQAKSKFIKNQLKFYIQFLKDLIKNRSVLTKKFYIVIPYDDDKERKKYKRKEAKVKTKKVKQNKKSLEDQEKEDVYKEEQRFERARKQLYIRASMIERTFRRFDINPKILNDKELLELYYTSYNKDRSVYQPMKNKEPDDYTGLRVKTRGGY